MTNKSRGDSHQEFKVPPAFKFQEGEKVLCFHGPLIYEAKCLQSRYDDEEKTNKYHIHYSGWNKSWDEWVPESRVLKHNEGNIQRQKELHKAQKAEPKGKKGKKRSVTGKEKETEGKEKDADDSRSSTPVHEKGGGGKASASATQSSSQESASDIPKRKRSKLDPSVETQSSTEDTVIQPGGSPPDKKDPLKTSSWWKVSLAGPAKNVRKHPSETSSSKTPDGIVERASFRKAKSIDQKKNPVSPKNTTARSPLEGKSTRQILLSNPKSVSPLKKLSPKKARPASKPKKSASPKKKLSPSKLYPVLKGRKLSVKINKLDLDYLSDEPSKSTPSIVNSEIDDLTLFGAYVVDQLRRMRDESEVTALKIEIQKLIQQNVKC